MTQDACFEVQDISAGYDGAPVIRGINLNVAPGEILAVFGPNGAGKSTLLSACAGFNPLLAGDILLDGHSIAGLSPNKLAHLGIGHVPEGRGIFRGLTVDEHFRLTDDTTASERAFSYFPALGQIRNRRGGLLSGGEQQMLALACALVREPRILLIDELSLGLAPIIVERLMPVVRSYADTSNCAVLLVEQHIHLALEVADRVAVLSHGEIVLDNTSESVSNDRELLMASYMGQRSA